MTDARARTIIGLSIALASGAASGQSAVRTARTEFDCALQGAEQATECLRLVAERANASGTGGDIERATALFVRIGALNRAEDAIERQWSQGPTNAPAFWNAVFTLARAHEERAAHREALRWYRRWTDDAKRYATADVLTAVHSGEGRGLMALGQRAQAYDAWRLAAHVWRAEHGYKLDDDGMVLEEFDGALGDVAPEFATSQQLVALHRLVRANIDPDAEWECLGLHENRLSDLAQCLRSLRPPPPGRPGAFEGLVEISLRLPAPFSGLVRAPRPRRTHQTRSRLGSAAFDRGNRASGEAWLGMLRITVDEIEATTFPRFHGTTDREFDAWTRSTITPRLFAVVVLLWNRAYLFAHRAIATGVPEIELAATPLLAGTFATLAQRINAVEQPPSWRRAGPP